MRYYISYNDEYLPGPNGSITNILWFKESFYEDRSVNDSDRQVVNHIVKASIGSEYHHEFVVINYED